jgi:hypothetical protein
MVRLVLALVAAMLAMGPAAAWAAEEPEKPLLTLVAEANQRIADLRQNAALTSAQKDLKIAKEVADLKTLAESKVWAVDASVVDVTKATAPGTYHLIVDAPPVGIEKLDMQEVLTDQFIMGLAKGVKLKVFMRLTAAEQANALKLAVTAAGLDEKKLPKAGAPLPPATGKTAAWATPAPGKPVIRVACGASMDDKDAAGMTWEADQPYGPGKTWGYVPTAGGATSTRVYSGGGMGLAPGMGPEASASRFSSERYTYKPLTYQFDVPLGKYTVQLGFCERFVPKEGARVFSVDVPGTPGWKDLDVFKEAGGSGKDLILTFTGVKVLTGKLPIALIANGSPGATISRIQITQE